MNRFISPKQAQLFISEVCSEGCHYCPYSRITSRKKKRILGKELSIKEWQEAVSFLHQKLGIKLFVLIGGEPTAKKGLEELISFMGKNLKDTTVVLSTSGIALLKKPELLEKLVKAGLENVVVSMDGLNKLLHSPSAGSGLMRYPPAGGKFDSLLPSPPVGGSASRNKIVLQEKIDLDRLLNKLSKDSLRKSALGYYLILEMRKRFPEEKFKFSVNCIVNQKTIPQIIPLYEFLSKEEIYLNLCPEQTICFGKTKLAALGRKKEQELKNLSERLVKIKRQKDNFLIPSLNFLESLPLFGINQTYRCSFSPFPSTIHLTSDGSIPFCIWKKGELKSRFNVMDLVDGKRNYEEWLNLWQNDEEGQKCSCSWSFIDRVGGFGVSREMKENNFWYKK
jgi:MoaA/NifB/PqqE/SkfB family radical SAM enzyme